jgi:hypothetical protein
VNPAGPDSTNKDRLEEWIRCRILVCLPEGGYSLRSPVSSPYQHARRVALPLDGPLCTLRKFPKPDTNDLGRLPPVQPSSPSLLLHRPSLLKKAKSRSPPNPSHLVPSKTTPHFLRSNSDRVLRQGEVPKGSPRRQRADVLAVRNCLRMVRSIGFRAREELRRPFGARLRSDGGVTR